DRYAAADEILGAAGYGWYEISNWAVSRSSSPGSSRCAHNMLYWTGGDWWGIGPGAHSHVGGAPGGDGRDPAPHPPPVAARRRPTPGQGRGGAVRGGRAAGARLAPPPPRRRLPDRGARPGRPGERGAGGRRRPGRRRRPGPRPDRADLPRPPAG